MIRNTSPLRLVLLIVAAIFSFTGAQGTPPTNFQNEVVIASGLTVPTAMEFLPDGRMLIAEFTGRVVIVQPGASVIDPIPVLQLTNVINEDVVVGGERGLVNVIADPNFTTNGYIYLFYTSGNPLRDRVSRFTMTGNTASLASEFVVWQGISESATTNHHGGGLLFGTDGKLYVSTGDDSDGPSCQLLTSDHGKLMRINSDGTVPTDNPFYDGAGPNIDSIWALGLRNPYRISLDAPTGRIYIGDVGYNTTEEVNVAIRGANYGWPVAEGPSGNAGFTNPIISYNHNGRDACVAGGIVYRGTQFPASYQGAYFFGDYAQNWIHYLTLNAAGTPTANINFDPTDNTLDSPVVGDPVMFKLGPDGSIYYVDFGWSPAENPAAIRRIRYTAGNQAPVAVVSSTLVTPPGTVSFSSAGSFDPEGQALSYLWTFGDNTTSTAANPTHVYQQNGMYVARLALSDSVNTTQSNALNISVGNPPTGTITLPSTGHLFMAGDTIIFSGTATDPEDGTLPPSAFDWSILFHHSSHVHPTISSLPGITSGSFTIPNTGHDFDNTTNYEIILTVTDSDGLQHRSSVTVYPELVSQTFTTTPAGIPLSLDGVNVATPFTRDLLIGYLLTIGAPNQIVGGNQYNFSSWSDGGAQSHTVVGPATTQTYTALYELGAVPPPANQVAALSFSESSGTVAADISGSGHTGTLVNGPVWTAGKYGTGLTFDGVNDYVSLANPGTLNFGTSDFTIALWVKRATAGAEHTLLTKVPTSGVPVGGKEFFISGTDNTLAFGAYNLPELHSTGKITNDGLWHHVAVSFVDSSNTLTFYIDGVAQGSGIINLPADGSGHVVKIGAVPDGSPGGFNGQLDEFRIFNRTLSLTEIQTVMNNAITPPPADTIPPFISNGQPSGTLPASTTQATIAVTTDENATSRYSTTPGTAYAAMTGTFTTTGGTAHSTTVTGLSNGNTYTYYVRSIDAAGNASTSDYPITFSVANPPVDNTPPVLSNGLPTGTLAAGTIQTTLSLTTNENATSRYSTTPGVAYAAMTGTFTTTGSTAHSTTVTGLTNGNTYTYYVRSIDAAGNASTSDYPITFSVASPPPPDTTFPTVSLTAPASGASVSGAATVSATAADNIGVVGVQFLLDGANLSAEDSSSPYSISWDTSTASVGAHTLAARARDAAGNQTTSAAIPVTVTVSPAPANQVTALSFSENTGTSAADNSGSGHTGTLVNGPLWTTGKYGTGLTFDGVNDYVSVANPGTLNFGTSDFTVAVWVKRASTGTEHTIFSKSANTTWSSGGKNFFINASNSRLGIGRFGGTSVFSNGSITNDGLWHHVAVTFVDSSNAVTFYIDGVASGGGTSSLPADISTHVLKIGAYPTGRFFNGQLDEFRVFNRVLSLSEIQTVMSNAIIPPAADTTPPVLSNGLPTGTLAAGTIQTTLSLTTNENATSRYSTTPGVAYAAMTGTFTTTGSTAHSTTVTGLTNGNTYTYYVRSIDAAGNASTSDYPITFSVASPPPPDTTFPTISLTAPASGASVSGTATVSATAADNIGVVGVQFLLDGANLGAEDSSSPYSISWDTTTASVGPHTLTARARDAAGNQTTSAAIPVTVTVSPAPANQVTALSFSENAGTSAADNSGAGHTGTLVNGPLWTAGKYGTGLTFDGVNDYVSVANPTTLNFGTSDFTVAVWVKRATTGAEHTLLTKVPTSGVPVGGKEFFISGTDNTLAFGAYNVPELHSTGTITNDGLWHHVAVTFVDSSNTLTFYIDGIARGSGIINLPADGSGHVVKIGAVPDGSPGGFNGQLDEFRIFNRSLSLTEIQTVMNNAIAP